MSITGGWACGGTSPETPRSGREAQGSSPGDDRCHHCMHSCRYVTLPMIALNHHLIKSTTSLISLSWPCAPYYPSTLPEASSPVVQVFAEHPETLACVLVLGDFIDGRFDEVCLCQWKAWLERWVMCGLTCMPLYSWPMPDNPPLTAAAPEQGGSRAVSRHPGWIR